MQKFALTRNMGANSDPEFAAWLLKLDNGRLPVVPGKKDLITISDKFVCTKPLKEFVFLDPITIDNLDAYSARVILCPTNDNCRRVNETILQNRILGPVMEYISIDTVVCDDPDDAANYPTESLHSIVPPGLPPHISPLMVGAIVMLLRNLGTTNGLCNGT